MNDATILTVADVSERYGVGQHTVLAWIASGTLAAVDVRRPGAKRATWRILPAAIGAFEAARTATPPTPRTRRRKRDPGIIRFYTGATG